MWLSHQKRLRGLYRIAAKYRLDTHLPDTAELSGIKRLIRLHPAAIGKSHHPLGVKLAFEEMGTLFLKLGQLLSTRSDLLPPTIIAQLALLQDQVAPVALADVIAQIENPKTGLGASVVELFLRFDETPLASASIAQVHSAQLKSGEEVVVKVVRPAIKYGIIQDFEILRQLSAYLCARSELFRALHLREIVEDYRQIMLCELNLTYEAANAQKMRANFLGSPLIYVPNVYLVSQSVLVSERIYGLPISRTDAFERLGYDKVQLAKAGLTIFFTQVFYHNFFHADMHPGNIFVETLPDGGAVANPRYVGLDCAIMGELSKKDQLIVARMLLSVMNENFYALVDIIAQAGWIPPSADKHALTKDMARTVSPMVSRPMDEIDFAGVLFAVLDIARRHQMTIPPQLVLLLKTLVHVEGLGRELCPTLDIWSLAKPILTDWVKQQLDPAKNLQALWETLPQTLLSSTELPQLAFSGVQSLSMLGARQEFTLKELQSIRADALNSRRHDWIALTGFGVFIAIGLSLPILWLSLVCYVVAVLFGLWRITV